MSLTYYLLKLVIEDIPDEGSVPKYLYNPELTSQDLQLWKDSFSFTFINQFSHYICECNKLFVDSSDYYSPYVSLFQSSGTGKSRLLKQLQETKKFLVLYINVAKPSQQSFPLPVTELYEYFVKYPQLSANKDNTHFIKIENYAQLQFLNFLKALLEEIESVNDIHSFIHMFWSLSGVEDINTDEVLEIDIETNQKKSYMKLKLENLLNKANGYTKNNIKEFETCSHTDIEIKWRNLLQQLYQQKSKYFDCIIKNDVNPKVLIAFDEARSLVSSDNGSNVVFIGICHALHSLPKAFFAVFTDTASKLSNFSPVSENDPSL